MNSTIVVGHKALTETAATVLQFMVVIYSAPSSININIKILLACHYPTSILMLMSILTVVDRFVVVVILENEQQNPSLTW